jgi:ribosomal protein L7/L12
LSKALPAKGASTKHAPGAKGPVARPSKMPKLAAPTARMQDEPAPVLVAEAGRTGPAVQALAAVVGTAAGAGKPKSTEQAPKRKTAADINVNEAIQKVKAAKASGSLGKLSLLELKAYLKSKSKPVSGKKADLLERIQALAEP